MAIKTKDGNVYKLRGPNPIMTEQELWNKDKLKFINFQFETETVKDTGKVVVRSKIEKVKPSEPEPVPIPEPVIKELPKPEPAIKELPKPVQIEELVLDPEPIVEEKSTQVKEVKLEPIDEIPKDLELIAKNMLPYTEEQLEKIHKYKVLVHCLPVHEHEMKDALSGEVHRMMAYGDKFTLEGVFFEKEDLYCKFWTNKELSKNSIIYPADNLHRWWKVQSIQKLDLNGGFIVLCIPSQVSPDFTD